MNYIQVPQISYRQYVRERYGPETIENFKKLEVATEKLANSQSSLTFLYKCRENNIIPKGLKLKRPVDSDKANRILKHAEEALVRERLQHHRKLKVNLSYEINNINQNISITVSEDDFNRINNCINNLYNVKLENKKRIQWRKFNSLIQEKHEQELENIRNNQSFINRTVINLSSKTLNTCEQIVLSKGLNFAITPKNTPKLDIITAIEEVCQNLPENISNEYKIRSKIILEKQFKIKSNITKEEKSSIINLKKDNDIKILNADKGNATVIMDKVDYNNKILNLLNEGQYKKLNKDPTKSIENKIYKTLFKYKNMFTDRERKLLTPHHSKPPHFYGLPKIHKLNIPLRPIVSSINSPCQNLAKFLLKILNPLAGNSDSFIKNTPNFLEKLKNVSLDQNDLLISFDVVSLFTNVPVDKTLLIRKLTYLVYNP